MYCPASNGVGSPSKRTQKVDSESVMSSRRTSVALYCGASASMTRVSVTRSVMRGMLPGRSRDAEGHPARPWSEASSKWHDTGHLDTRPRSFDADHDRPVHRLPSGGD